jgi:hypothetical protein
MNNFRAEPHEARVHTLAKVKLLEQFLTPKLADIPVPASPQGPAKFATILAEETKQLMAMDRYENAVQVETAAVVRKAIRRPFGLAPFNIRHV